MKMRAFGVTMFVLAILALSGCAAGGAATQDGGGAGVAHGFAFG